MAGICRLSAVLQVFAYVRYKDLVDDEDHERLTRVLTALEKKDEMQQRMEAITKSVPFSNQLINPLCIWCFLELCVLQIQGL